MPVRAQNAVVVAAAACGSVAAVAAALAAVYAWHRLRGPLPLVAWAASSCANPRRGGVGDLEAVSASLKVPENGKVQVCADILKGTPCHNALCVWIHYSAKGVSRGS